MNNNTSTVASNLQWSAIEVDAEQYGKMYHLAKNVLHLYAAIDMQDFSVFAFPNGSLFELYGPNAPATPWRNGKDGSAFGFAVENLETAINELKTAGAVMLEDTKVVPQGGENGADYRYQLFRAADNRIYAVAQRK